MDDSLIREVNEAVRHDKLQRAWREHRMLLLLLVVALILGTAGGQLYRQYKTSQSAEFTGRLLEGIQQFKGGEPKKAARHFAILAKDSNGERAALSNLWRARAALKAGETKEAADVLRVLAESGETGTVWQGEACVWLAGLGEPLPAGCTAKTGPFSSLLLIFKAAEALAVGEAEEARALLKRAEKADNVTPQELSLIEQLSLLVSVER
jgi:hypothetical protein